MNNSNCCCCCESQQKNNGNLYQSNCSTSYQRQYERSDALTAEDIIDHLREELRKAVRQLHDCQDKLRFFCASITKLQEECSSKDATVGELRNEIDKFRQVVKPLTQAFLQQRAQNIDYEDINWNPGIESTRVLPTAAPRIKRQGYSAEPLSSMAGAEDDLIKIPKSDE